MSMTMTMAVQATTDQLPGLEKLIAKRHTQGLDTYDEWWEGVYRVVTGPSPEHGLVVTRLAGLLDRQAIPAGLWVITPLNVGVDKVDARVPDIGVIRPDVERTSPACVATAELVVEMMSPGEKRGEKLSFYEMNGVKEYLEIDPRSGDVRLLANVDGAWQPIERSGVIELHVDDVRAVLAALD